MANAEKKALALNLYINSDFTQKKIAEIVNVSDRTLRTWVDEGEWDKQRELKKVTRGQLLQDAYKQLAAVNKAIEDGGGIPNKEQYDAKSILRKEIETLEDNSTAVYIEVFEEFIKWLCKSNPKYANVFGDLSMQFITEINK